jgi:tetratricopeptide (TPR) repeat protein
MDPEVVQDVPAPPADPKAVQRPGRLRRWLAACAPAVPALLTGALALGVVVASMVRPSTAVANAYMRKANSAFQARDYETARVCYARLAEGSINRPDAVWRLAETYDAMGQPGRAFVLWDRLAPLDADLPPGYAQAHLRCAEDLLKATNGQVSQEVAAKAEEHLKRAINADPGPESLKARAMLAAVFMARPKPARDLAADALAPVSVGRPDVQLILCDLYNQLGHHEQARHEADLARREAERMLDAAPEDVPARLWYTKACAYLKDFRAAVRVLQQGLKRTNDPGYHILLASVYADWFDAIKDSADPGVRLLLLEEGLRNDPTNGPLLDRFGGVLRAGGPNAEKARRTLRSLLATGKVSAAAHFTLGVDASLRGDLAAARFHLEQAAKLDPKATAVANNLAWFLAIGPDPDLPRALSLADLALEQRPNQREYRGTRGVILSKLGRWKEAVSDLEAGLEANPNDPDLHRSLADAYEHVGDPNMAAEHRSRVPGPASPGPGK